MFYVTSAQMLWQNFPLIIMTGDFTWLQSLVVLDTSKKAAHLGHSSGMELSKKQQVIGQNIATIATANSTVFIVHMVDSE